MSVKVENLPVRSSLYSKERSTHKAQAACVITCCSLLACEMLEVTPGFVD